MLDRVTTVAAVLRATQMIPMPTARQYAEVAVQAADNHTANALQELHAEFTEADHDGASSNDIVQILDDFLVKHGLPTVLYRT